MLTHDLGRAGNSTACMLRYVVPPAYLETGGSLLLPGLAGMGAASPAKALVSGLSGFLVPSFADVLGDPRYGGLDREKALNAFLTEWQQAIGTLWRYQNAAFSIRFLWDPCLGTVQLGCFFRVTLDHDDLIQEIATVGQAFRQIFETHHLRVVPADEAQLERFLSSYSDKHLVELRQKEEVFTLHVRKEAVGAYGVLPFSTACGGWVDLMKALTLQSEPVLIAIHLQPTQLLLEETLSITHAASLAKELIDFSYQGRTGSISFKNPQAETVFRIYHTLQKRLGSPYLGVAHVAAGSPSISRIIADRLGEAIIGRAAPEIETQVDEVPRGYEAASVSPSWRGSADAVLNHLWFAASCPSHASTGKERLPYLVDARGAAAMFRLPVPVETGLPGIEVRKLKVGQDLGRRNSEVGPGHLLLGSQEDGNLLVLPVKDLTRHALICGIPGSGKTNTSLSLLSQLWCKHKVPFWVFEPPKTEYRGLTLQPGFEDLLVFTVGDESTAPLRINPFELLPDIPVEQHIGNLKVCFETALPKIDDSGALLGMFIENAIRDAYKAKGWKSWETSAAGREYPTLQSLLPWIKKGLDGYAGEVRQNLDAAIGNRVRSLLRGSKGRMFNIERGIPVAELMRRPVIFELLPMGADAPLVLMFLLTFLHEFALKREIEHPLGLEHVTMIEEAHVIMARPVGNSSEAATGVADFFERILAELRSSGEGVVIAEQSPTKLIKGAIDLTNLKIVHRLAGPDEVQAVGGAMTATDRQRETFQRLKVGEAAVHMQNLEGLTFMRAPNYKEKSGYRERLPTGHVRTVMTQFYLAHPHLRRPFHGCILCASSQCHQQAIESALDSDGNRANARRAAIKKSKSRTSVDKAEWNRADTEFHAVLLAVARSVGLDQNSDAVWCVWTQLVDEDFIFGRQDRKDLDVGLSGLQTPPHDKDT